jgi:selenoprotein W-related protein
VPKAVGLSESLLSQYKNNISELTIIPSSGGVFEVKFDDELIFSKKSLDRFPEENEVEDMVKSRM